MSLPYRIEEGVILLPERFVDTSLNVLSFPESNSALVISRAILNPSITLDQYLDKEFKNAKTQLTEYTVSEKKEIKWMDFDKVYAIVSHFQQNGLLIYQLAYTTIKDNKLVAFTYTQHQAFDETTRLKAESIFQTLVKY